jgi:hypothetical protein
MLIVPKSVSAVGTLLGLPVFLGRLSFVRKYRWHRRPDVYASKVSP